MPYFISVSRNKHIIDGPYWEHLAFRINGTLLSPEKLSGKSIIVNILGNRQRVPMLETPEKFNFEPKCVGSLIVRGEHREFLGSLPFDVMQTICLLLQADKIKYLELNGYTLYRGSANIMSIRFERETDPEDWI